MTYYLGAEDDPVHIYFNHPIKEYFNVRLVE